MPLKKMVLEICFFDFHHFKSFVEVYSHKIQKNMECSLQEVIIMNDTSNTMTITCESLPILLSVKNAEAIDISRSAFYRLIHRGGVPTVSIEGRIFIPRDRFIEWIENKTEIN